MAVLDFSTKLYECTGTEPERIVLPARAYDILLAELRLEPLVKDGDPISGLRTDGRMWLACTEIVADVRRA
jgi:hypothetical protein